MSQSSGTKLEPNIAGLLCYVLGWITGLVFFLIEKDDDFVRFHAMQSIVFFGAVTVAMIVLDLLRMIPYIWPLFVALESLLGLFAFVMWIILMIKAYQGERLKLPIVGDMAEKWSQ
jgi:uncharacterized membrane protein